MTLPVKVALAGHTYLAPENRKSLDALSRQVTVRVISPVDTRDPNFAYTAASNRIQGDGWEISCYRRLPLLPASLGLLRSAGFGLGRYAPDIVHIEYDPFTPLFVQLFLAARRCAPRARFVCMIRQNTFTRRGVVADRIKIGLARFFVPRIHRFIAVNSGVARLYQTLFNARPEQMTHCTQVGVDTGLFSPATVEEAAACRSRFSLARGDFLIGYCGRLQPDKGIEELLAAVSLMRERGGGDVRLALLGGGEMGPGLRERSLTDRWLTVLDRVPHGAVADFLKGLDAFVMPSRVLEHHEEHDAHALMEALSVGIPSVGTVSGAIPDVLDSAGLLVRPGETVELADALTRLAGDDRLREACGRRGRERIVSRYSLEAVAASYAETYCQVLGLRHTWPGGTP